MNKALADKLKSLPKEPGVYFHKDKDGEIIYVGKAARLNVRVRHYFQKNKLRDPKTEALVSEIVDTDWMVVESELEALFLEAEMVRRYMPRYNILLRDDKAMSYIRIDFDSDYPTVTTTRRPFDDGAKYFGPYFSLYGIKSALRLLRKIFPFATKRAEGGKRASLNYHIGLDPGLEEGRTSLEDYRANLRRLMVVIEGRRSSLMREIERDMKRASKDQQFEQAARLRNQLNALKNLGKQIIFSDKEFLDISKDNALTELADLLSFSKLPKRIEGFDISHMSGTNVVASMVVFSNGVSDKAEYRKFKTSRDYNNDFANMNETITRRLSPRNQKLWGLPDLVLIDGGKGQLDAALAAKEKITIETGDPKLAKLAMIGLAKKQEQIVIKKDQPSDPVRLDQAVVKKLGGYVTESDDYFLVNLPHSSHVVKLLQRIRDESHRFAVSYHTVLKRKQQTTSLLDGIPGVGAVTRRKLLKSFGSVKAIANADVKELGKVVGLVRAKQIHAYLNKDN